jgi:hypothetical protein
LHPARALQGHRGIDRPIGDARKEVYAAASGG